MQKIPIIIVDDHDFFRIGIQMSLEAYHPDIVVVGEAKCGYELFTLLKTITADVVLLDIMLPDMNGIEIARRLKTEHPDIKILVITSETSTFSVEEMVNIGVEGFISKFYSNLDILAEAIRSIAQGLEYYGKDISQIISRIYLSKKKKAQIHSEFTPMEKRILDCFYEGLTGKQTADLLGIAYKTMDWHKTNIFRKLDIHSTVELISYAMKHGIIKNEN